MEHYKTPNGTIRAIEPGQEYLIQSDWTGPLTDTQLAGELAPTTEQLAEAARGTRDGLFNEADIAIFKLEDTGGDPSQWRSYREALRDVPQQSGFPETITWPTKPGV